MARHMAWWLNAVAVIVALTAAAALAQETDAQTQPTTQPAATAQVAVQPPGDEPGGPNRGGRGDRRDSDTEVLAVLKDRLPLRYQRLMELKDSDPNEYSRNLGRMRRWYGYWKHMPPAIQDADIIQQTMSVEIWRLVEQIRQNPPQEPAALQTEIAEAAGKQFDAETVVMAYRLEMLEKALERMRQHLAERREKRDTMVAERVDRLMRSTTQPAQEQRGGGRRGDEFGPPSPPDDRPPGDGPPGEGSGSEGPPGGGPPPP